jgi:hypothetical protein
MDLGTVLLIALVVAMVAMHLRPHRGHGAGGGGCCGGHAHTEHERDRSAPAGEPEVKQDVPAGHA